MSKKGPIISLVGGIYLVVVFFIDSIPYLLRTGSIGLSLIYVPILFILAIFGAINGLRGKKSGTTMCKISGIIGIIIYTVLMLLIIPMYTVHKARNTVDAYYIELWFIVIFVDLFIPSLIILIGGIIGARDLKK